MSYGIGSFDRHCLSTAFYLLYCPVTIWLPHWRVFLLNLPILLIARFVLYFVPAESVIVVSVFFCEEILANQFLLSVFFSQFSCVFHLRIWLFASWMACLCVLLFVALIQSILSSALFPKMSISNNLDNIGFICMYAS